MGYIILLGLALVAFYVLALNIEAVSQNRYPALRVVCTVLFVFSMTRYITLGVYGDRPTQGILETLRYFYFATSIGLTLTTASAIWYITPLYREKIGYTSYLACFLPWIAFYLYVLLGQPTEIVQGPQFGYRLVLIGQFPRYLSIAQGSFITIMIILCLIGIIRYKNLQMRVQYIVIILAQILLTIDGITFDEQVARTVPPFTLSEIAGFLAVYYAFKGKMIEVRGIDNKA